MKIVFGLLRTVVSCNEVVKKRLSFDLLEDCAYFWHKHFLALQQKSSLVWQNNNSIN